MNLNRNRGRRSNSKTAKYVSLPKPALPCRIGIGLTIVTVTPPYSTASSLFMALATRDAYLVLSAFRWKRDQVEMSRTSTRSTILAKGAGLDLSREPKAIPTRSL